MNDDVKRKVHEDVDGIARSPRGVCFQRFVCLSENNGNLFSSQVMFVAYHTPARNNAVLYFRCKSPRGIHTAGVKAFESKFSGNSIQTSHSCVLCSQCIRIRKQPTLGVASARGVSRDSPQLWPRCTSLSLLSYFFFFFF